MLTAVILQLTPTGKTAMETQALQKATEAAYVQSGVSEFVSRTESQTTDFAKREGDRLGVTKYVGVIGAGIQVVRTQSITFHISRGTIATAGRDFSSITFTF